MSENIKEIQVQSVIYNNNKESLMRAMRALQQAVRVYKRKAGEIKVKLVYGDASPNPVFSDGEVREIVNMLVNELEFDYVKFGYNSGTAKGHNTMASDYDGEFLMIMNPDVILEPTCLLRLMEPFSSSKVGVTEARQTPLEHAKEYDKKTGETEWASTACAVLRKKVFDEIGGFDADTFFMYCDDLDYSWRVRLAGYKVIYVPSAIIYHSKNLTTKATWQPTKAEVYYSAEASLLLAYKWSDFERVEYLQQAFSQSDNEDEKKAALEFEKRKTEGRLPVCIDDKQGIANFSEENYCEMRFVVGEEDEEISE